MASTANAAKQADPVPSLRAVRPIDLVHLAKQCMGDVSLERDVLRLFDTTIKTYFGRLELPGDVALNLHSIKGAAGGVGAWTIADLAKACEADIQAGRPLTPERLADLAIAVEEAREFIARILSADGN